MFSGSQANRRLIEALLVHLVHWPDGSNSRVVLVIHTSGLWAA